ncbi:hypothetical protein BDY19DRAFT_1023312 [Irpex rosettiformis]|uniref:Uncharacterized protein n=1 Tax=Irpex rosettiformis TaxID=378272 RepID=A0ACB8TSB4_9APHY|nr:hypothetical protein BDY19DRAFT_1023312 [Irpex rosettiformis]
MSHEKAYMHTTIEPVLLGMIVKAALSSLADRSTVVRLKHNRGGTSRKNETLHQFGRTLAVPLCKSFTPTLSLSPSFFSLMSAGFFARAVLLLSLVMSTAGLKLTRADLQNRALSDLTQNTLFTPANSHGIFVLINVNGQDVPVQVDLGSGDLYVAGHVIGDDELAATSTEAEVDFDFLQPRVTGNFPIKLGVPVSIGGRKIEQPIILDPNANKGFQQAFPDNSAVGVLGFRASPISAVANGLKHGRSPMDEVYSHLATSTNAFSTILFTGFDESTPTTVEFSGLFTVGEPIDLQKFFPGSDAQGPDFKQITKQPAITLGGSNEFKISKFTVNGADTTLPSSATGLIDTTNVFTVAPLDVVQALYSNIPGGFLNQGSGTYYLPCTVEVNATITIDPMTSAIPLDPSTLIIRNPANSSECVGSFMAQKAAVAPTSFALGLSFLPNAYLLTGYVDSNLKQPIYKLLPLTDPAEAHQYFVSTRLGSQSSWPQYTSYPGSTPSSPSSSSASGVKAAGLLEDTPNNDNSNNSHNLPNGSVADQLRHCLPAIIVVAILVGLIAIGGVIFALVRRRRSGSRKESAYRNIHVSENMDSSKGLYGHDEAASSKYSDPYYDKM